MNSTPVIATNTIEAALRRQVDSRLLASGAAVWTMRALLVLGGSLLVTACAKLSVPLPHSPVPVSMSNFGVLLVGLLLGGRAGFAALVLYLMEGAVGLPVFSHGSLGLLGPTGGYLMAYPFVAFIAGAIGERCPRNFWRALSGSVLAEILLFAVGIGWLIAVYRVPLGMAAQWGLYPFLIAEVAKVVAAAGISNRLLPGARKA